MHVFKCKICEDPYLGTASPSNCPFCGAPKRFIILAENWVDRELPALTDASRMNLEKTLRMEMENARFYQCALGATEDPQEQAMFFALSRVEVGHADSACRLLGRSAEDVEEDAPEDAADYANAYSAISPQDHLKEALRREREAVEFYTSAADLAEEELVKEFFEALIDVENDHISLSNLSLGVV
jgi:rubrerythrin